MMRIEQNRYHELRNDIELGNPPPDACFIPPQVAIPYPPMVSTITIADPAPRWSWCNLVTSVFSLLCCSCCSCCFGVIATVLSILSYTDHKSKDFGRSHSKRQCALGFAVTAIVIGSLFLISFIALVLTCESMMFSILSAYSNYGMGDRSSTPAVNYW